LRLADHLRSGDEGIRCRADQEHHLTSR
jgi:hypothetical protein